MLFVDTICLHVENFVGKAIFYLDFWGNKPAFWRRQWPPTPVLLPGKSHGWRSLVGCSPWGREESDTTEQLHFHFSLSCIGEGNGKPLQYCCLENPREGGAWWAAVYGVAQSWTRLKRLSSGSSSSLCLEQCLFMVGSSHKYLVSNYRYREGNGTPLRYSKIPWTEEPGRLQSMGSRRVGHD